MKVDMQTIKKKVEKLRTALKGSKIKDREGFLKLYLEYLKSLQENDSASNNFTSQEFAEAPTLEYSKLEQPEKAKPLLKQIVVCRLNGGLGTTLGLSAPKFSVIIKQKKNFLDLAVEQLKSFQEEFKVKIPFVLMNSFHTHQATTKAIKKYKDLKIYSFQQNCYPRLTSHSLISNLTNSLAGDLAGGLAGGLAGDLLGKTFAPLDCKEFGEQAYYPPGHGDFFLKFQQSGLLENFINQGKKYIFIANIDNLGARLDLKILNFIAKQNCPFLIEAVKKTKQDSKGGSLLLYKKKIKLLESAELETIPRNEQKKLNLTVFNTNNLWIDLLALQKALLSNSWQLDCIANWKETTSLKKQSQNILQLENTIVSAVSNFAKAKIIQVPRDRFIPVKNKENLAFVRSLYW